MSNIVQSEVYIDSCIEMFLKRKGEFAKSGEIIDLAKWSQMYAFDVIGELYFSKMFGFMEYSADHGGYIAALDALLPFIAASCVMPTYMRTLFMMSGMTLPSVRKAIKAFDDISKAASDCVADRQDLMARGESLRQDILANLFGIHMEKGEKLDFQLPEIKTEVYTALFAGSDTTAAALSSIFYHVMKNPEVYNSLVAEIDVATKSGALSSPNVRYSEAIKLPYLSACIKEGMRVHPSVGLTMPRHVPKGGCNIVGEWFPAGTRIGANAAVVHFNKVIFGEDSDDYNPARWFREDAKNMDRYMLHFGAGARTCIGKNISLCEIYKIIPQCLRSFDIELTNPQKEWSTNNLWFNKPSKIFTRFEARSF